MDTDKAVKAKLVVDSPNLAVGEADGPNSTSRSNELMPVQQSTADKANRISPRSEKQTDQFSKQTSQALPIPTWSAIVAVNLIIPLTLMMNAAWTFLGGGGSWHILAALIQYPLLMLGGLAIFPGIATIYFCTHVYLIHKKLTALKPEQPPWSAVSAVLATSLQGTTLLTAIGLTLALLVLILGRVFDAARAMAQAQPHSSVLTVTNAGASMALILAVNLIPCIVAFGCFRSFGSVISCLNANTKQPVGLRIHPLLIGLALALPGWLAVWSAGTPVSMVSIFLLVPLGQLYAFKLLRDIIKTTNATFNLKTTPETIKTPWWLSSKTHSLLFLFVWIFLAISLASKK